MFLSNEGFGNGTGDDSLPFSLFESLEYNWFFKCSRGSLEEGNPDSLAWSKSTNEDEDRLKALGKVDSSLSNSEASSSLIVGGVGVEFLFDIVVE
jgi:hypothetical protein